VAGVEKKSLKTIFSEKTASDEGRGLWARKGKTKGKRAKVKKKG